MISVIVPNYNHSKYLAQRIDSILAQSYQEFELIILDDRSPDESREVIERYRDNPHVSHIVYNEENSGSTFKQWDLGFSLAQGEYIWIAESDDYADPKFLERCVEELEQNPVATLCYCDSHIVDAEGRELKDHFLQSYIEPTENKRSILFAGESFVTQKMVQRNMIYNASMVVFRKRYLTNLNPIYKRFKCCGDWLFWVMLANQGYVVRVTERLNYFRQHPQKVSVESNTHISRSETVYIQLFILLYIHRDWRNLKSLTDSFEPRVLIWEQATGINALIADSKISRHNRLYFTLYIYNMIKKNRDQLKPEIYKDYTDSIKRNWYLSTLNFLMKNNKTLCRYLKSRSILK